MGCMQAKAKTPDQVNKKSVLVNETPQPIQNQSQIIKIKKQLQQQLKSSQAPLSDKLKDSLQKVNQRGQFQCKFVGMHFIHNYLMFVREKVINEKSQLILFDLRPKDKIQEVRIMKTEYLDIAEQLKNQESLQAFKNKVHFRHIFIIGQNVQFETEQFSQLLQKIVELEMKPFCLFMHRFKKEILEYEFPYLMLQNQEKRKLNLYPQIVLKCKDIGLEKQKQKFQLLLGKSQMINAVQLIEMQISKALIIDDDEPTLNKHIQDNLKGISIDRTSQEIRNLINCSQKETQRGESYKKLYLELAKKASSSIQKAVSGDYRIAILAQDCDNIGASLIIFYLIENHSMTFSSAFAILKERRISVKIIDSIQDILKEFSESKNPSSQQFKQEKPIQKKPTNEKTFSERMDELIKSLYIETLKKPEKLTDALSLFTTLIKNINDNPSDEKFRQFKKDNPKIKEKLTKYKFGQEIIKHFGFQELKDEATGEVLYKLSTQLSISFIKGRRLDFEKCVSIFVSSLDQRDQRDQRTNQI